MSYCTPVSVSVETRGLGFHPCPISSFLSLNLFQNRVFHPKEAFTRPFHQGHHALGTDPGFLLYWDSSSNTLHSSDIHRPSWLALPGQTISAFPHKPRAQLSGDNESFVRLGGQSCPGWSLGISARWPPLPWLGYPHPELTSLPGLPLAPTWERQTHCPLCSGFCVFLEAFDDGLSKTLFCSFPK